MSSYILALENKVRSIDSVEFNNPYEVKSKSDTGKLLVYDKRFKASLASSKFLKLYISYVKKLEEFFDDNPDDSGFSRLISEGDRLENILKVEFIKYLSKKEFLLYLEDLTRVNSTLAEEYQKFKRKSYRR